MNRYLALVLVIFMPFAVLAQEDKSSWTERFDLFGDLRLRHDYTGKTDTPDRHQERLRLRAGFNAKVNDKIKAKVRLATAQASGSGGDPISTNQTLTENSNKKSFYVDMAQVDWALADGQSLTLGKMENPLRVVGASQLMFDVDYTPEGAAYNGQFGGVFAKVAAYSLQERAPQADGTSEPDSWLMSGLVGFKGELSESMTLTVAGGYHQFGSLKNNGALTGFSGNSSIAAGTRYANEYQVGELMGELRFKGEGHAFGLYFDALNNFSITEENRALLAGVIWQALDENGKAKWSAGYAYETIAKDATVSSINNSDFASGIDGAHGHILTAGYTVAPNTLLNLTWNNAHVDNNGKPYKTDRALLDFIVSF